jgi:hypothetical protein
MGQAIEQAEQAGTGLTEQDRQIWSGRILRTGKPECRTGQAELDWQNRTGRTGLSG